MIFLAISIYAIQSIAGFLFVHLVWDIREPKALVFKFFLGAGMGAGLSSVLYFWWCWLYLPVNFYPLCAGIIVLILVLLISRKEFAHLREDWQRTILYFKGIQKKALAWIALMVASVSFSILRLWEESKAMPHGFYDAWAIWNAAARFIYYSGTGWHQIFSQNAWEHPDYPLLAPLNVAAGWLLIGSSTNRIPLAFTYVMAFSLLGLVFSTLFLARDLEQGVLATILISSFPALALLGSFQYSEEIGLTLLILATGALLYQYTVSVDSRLLFLAGLAAGFAGWTKNEGQLLIVCSLLVSLLLSICERKNLFKYFLGGLLLPLITILTFKSVTPPNDLFVSLSQSFQQLSDISRYQLILSSVGVEFFKFGGWKISFFLLLLLYALLVWVKPAATKGKAWVPLVLLLLQAGGYYMIYVITPRDLPWQLHTSLERLIFQLLPLLIFWLFILLRSPADIFANKPALIPAE